MSQSDVFYRNVKFFLNSVPNKYCPDGGHPKYYVHTHVGDPRKGFLIQAFHTPMKTVDDHRRAIYSARLISDAMTRKMRRHVAKRGDLRPEQVEAIQVFPYSPCYLFYDTLSFSRVVWNTALVGRALVLIVYMLTSALRVQCALLLSAIVTMISGDLLSWMHFWHVPVTAGTFSFVLICIGVAVRFATSLLHAYDSSILRSKLERQSQAIRLTGRQVLFGIIGTKVFGLFPLSYAEPEYFRLFVGLCVNGCLLTAFVVPSLVFLLGMIAYFNGLKHILNYISFDSETQVHR